MFYTTATTITQINPRMRVKAAQNKVCTETEAVFNSEFWTSLDVVATALVSLSKAIKGFISWHHISHITWHSCCENSYWSFTFCRITYYHVFFVIYVVYFLFFMSLFILLAFYPCFSFCICPDISSDWHCFYFSSSEIYRSLRLSVVRTHFHEVYLSLITLLGQCRCKAVRGCTVRNVRKMDGRFRHFGHERQHTSGCALCVRVILFIIRSSRGGHPVVHVKKFPLSARTLRSVGEE